MNSFCVIIAAWLNASRKVSATQCVDRSWHFSADNPVQINCAKHLLLGLVLLVWVLVCGHITHHNFFFVWSSIFYSLHIFKVAVTQFGECHSAYGMSKDA